MLRHESKAESSAEEKGVLQGSVRLRQDERDVSQIVYGFYGI